MTSARTRVDDGRRSGVWGVPLSLSSAAGLGERKDSAPGEATCWFLLYRLKCVAGVAPGEIKGLSSSRKISDQATEEQTMI